MRGNKMNRPYERAKIERPECSCGEQAERVFGFGPGTYTPLIFRVKKVFSAGFQIFGVYCSKMVETPNISVEINNKSESIYKSTVKNEGNDLNSLISHLKSMQQKVNEVLTKLVQTELSSSQNEILADEDSEESDESEDEDEILKAKKCKYK